ncbi:universal stress protein YxiE-like [Ostrea edulis]|uniref:universal stress protein YxiE-like n=1 Tax=Ostrea edulis TaxID=37623 RepID=UPI0024AFAB30|nr:universal stress protein YxiE-like [Ostrea edulis]
MTTRKRVVLVAIDGSDHAEYALNWYLDNIHRPNDVVIGVHSADYSKLQSQPLTLLSSDKSLITNFLETEEESVKKLAANFESKVLKNQIDGKFIRINGDPGPGIVEVSNNEKAAVIVMGSRGLGTIRRTLLGSVSSYIMYHASVPVIVCRQ